MDANQVFSQVTVNAVMVYLLEHLKRSKYFPWLTMESAKANKITAALMAGATAIGIHFTFDHTAGTLLISGLCGSCIFHGIADWAKSFVAQQLVYDGVVAPNQKLDQTVQAVAPKGP